MNATSLLNAVLNKYRGVVYTRDRELGRRADVSTLNVEGLTSYIETIGRTSIIQLDEKGREIFVKRVLVPALSKGTTMRTSLEAAYIKLHRRALMTLAQVVNYPLKKISILTPHVGVLVALLQNKYKSENLDDTEVFDQVIRMLQDLDPVNVKDHVGELFKALDNETLFDYQRNRVARLLISMLEDLDPVNVKDHVRELLKVLAMKELILHVGLRDKVASLLEQIPNVDWNEYAKEIHAIEHLKYDFFMKQLTPEHRPNKLTRFK